MIDNSDKFNNQFISFGSLAIRQFNDQINHEQGYNFQDGAQRSMREKTFHKLYVECIKKKYKDFVS